jgi:hypothetical protein
MPRFHVALGSETFEFLASVTRQYQREADSIGIYAQEAVLAWLVAQIEVRVAAGALAADDRNIWVRSDDAAAIEAVRGREKECFWQHGSERELLCSATVTGAMEKTTTATCGGCRIPDKAAICAALAWPDVRLQFGGGGRDPITAECEEGRAEVENGSGCSVDGSNRQCWHRQIDVVVSSLPVTADAGERLAEEFDALDLAYRAAFGGAELLGRAQVRAGFGLAATCLTGADFNRGVAVVSELIDRLDCSAQLTAPAPPGGWKSLAALQELMRQEFQINNLPGIATLRNVRAARNSYPIHSGDPQARQRLAQLGIKFPPDDWNEAWLTLLTATRAGLREIRDVVSERIP